MKRLAGMVAVWVVAAAHAQTADVAPAQAQAPSSAQASAAAPAPTPGSTEPRAPDPADPADLVQATSYLKSAAADFTNCRRPSACNAYFESFGVAISFADGSIAPFAHTQRLMATSRECIKKAKVLAEEGERSLAVQWAMASRVENSRVRDWLGNHPEAVLEALRQVSLT